jgi:hypothetical protein
MSASLLSFLSPAKIEEKLPDKVLPSAIKAGSVVTYRSRSRYLPTSGTSYQVPTGSKQIQFRITGNDYLDMSTAVLHLRVAITNPARPTGALIQEGIYSIIQRVRASLNSVIVQDTDNSHVCANVKVLNTMPRQVYDSALGQYMGLYKKSRDPVVATTYGAAASAIASTISGYYDKTETNDSSTNGSSFYIPLSLICSSIGNLETFLPLRNVGNFELTLFLEDPSVCFFNPFAGSMTNATYTVSDLSLEVDSVQLNGSIVQLYDRLSADTSETGGVVMPVSVDVVQNVNYSGSDGQKSVSISRGTTALTQISIVKRDQAQVGTSTNQSLSSYQNFTQSRAQFRLGSRLYPTTTSDSQARMLTETAHAFGNLNNLYAGGLVNRQFYEENDNNQGAFTYAYNFRRVLTEDLGMDGENSIQSGSIIIYEFTDNPAVTTAVLTAIIESLRYIELKGSAVNVSGL